MQPPYITRNNMEYIVFIAAVVIVLIGKCLYDNYIFEKEWKAGLENSYGKFQEKEEAREKYSEEKLWEIGYYSRSLDDEAQPGSSCIDDMTWNDLGMDSVFSYINQTGCSAGEEYLYAILRHPLTDVKKLDEREKILKFYKDFPEERIKLRKLFARTGKIKLSSYYSHLLKCEYFLFKPSLKYGLFCGLLTAALILFFAGDFMGFPMGLRVLILIGIAVSNMCQYYMRKAEIEPYYNVISYTLNLFYLAEGFVKFTGNNDVLKPYGERMKVLLKEFNKFRKGSALVISGRNRGGGPEEIFLEYFRMLFHIDLIKFNSMIKMLVEKRDFLREIFEILGLFDSMYAAASFREYVKDYALPEFTFGEKGLSFSMLYHPLIKEPVKNSLDTVDSVLMTGSNASGKSTFLKTIGVNAILAQSINTVLAESYRACFFRIFSSMALSDNLLEGESYYIVEIKSLLRIIEAAKNGDVPVLCFIDEVLRGTNTVERIAASQGVLSYLGNKNALCFAATHDIELTRLLHGSYRNLHFEERVKMVEGKCEVIFDYKLKNGPAATRNAILLLENMGYDKELIAGIRENLKEIDDHFS